MNPRRKRGAYVSLKPPVPVLPLKAAVGAKKFNTCCCGSPWFVEKMGDNGVPGWVCKKCRVFYDRKEWSLV